MLKLIKKFANPNEGIQPVLNDFQYRDLANINRLRAQRGQPAWNESDYLNWVEDFHRTNQNQIEATKEITDGIMDLTSLATTGISGKAAKFISKVPDALEEITSTDFSDPYQYPELAIVLASLASNKMAGKNRR